MKYIKTIDAYSYREPECKFKEGDYVKFTRFYNFNNYHSIEKNSIWQVKSVRLFTSTTDGYYWECYIVDATGTKAKFRNQIHLEKATTKEIEKFNIEKDANKYNL